VPRIPYTIFSPKRGGDVSPERLGDDVCKFENGVTLPTADIEHLVIR
jgi:hypothetical protein